MDLHGDHVCCSYGGNDKKTIGDVIILLLLSSFYSLYLFRLLIASIETYTTIVKTSLYHRHRQRI